MYPETQVNEPDHVKRVLVALDDSPRATAVFDVGAEYARRLGAKLYLVRTITLPPHFSPPSKEDRLPRRLSEVAERDLDAIAKRAPDIALAETLITFGLPGQMIPETAAKLKVDLIVIGSHGYHSRDRMLGTTAAAIANHSAHNVLVVHASPPNGNQRAEVSH